MAEYERDKPMRVMGRMGMMVGLMLWASVGVALAQFTIIGGSMGSLGAGVGTSGGLTNGSTNVTLKGTLTIDGTGPAELILGDDEAGYKDGQFFGSMAGGSNFNASALSTGTVPLGRLSGITSAEMDAGTDAAYRSGGGGLTSAPVVLTYAADGTNVPVNGALGNRFRLLVTNTARLNFTNIGFNTDIAVHVAQCTNALFPVSIAPQNVISNGSLAITSGTNTHTMIFGHPDLFTGTKLFIDQISTNLQPQDAYGGLAATSGGDTCGTNLLFSWHAESTNVNSGTPIGCSVGDTTATAFSGATIVSSNYQDGANSISIPTASDYYQFDWSAATPILNTNAGTVDLWCYWTTITSAPIFFFSIDSTNRIYVAPDVSNKYLSVNYVTDGTLRGGRTGVNAIDVGAWYHIKIRWDTTAHSGLYLKITCDTTTGESNSADTGTTAFTATHGSTGTVNFGDFAGSGGVFFLDNIKIYNTWQ